MRKKKGWILNHSNRDYFNKVSNIRIPSLDYAEAPLELIKFPRIFRQNLACQRCG